MFSTFLISAAVSAFADPHAAAQDFELPEFRPAAASFPDAAACRAHLARLVGEARAAGFAAAEGPYDFAAGDVRVHIVRAQGEGHFIAEYRCEGDAFSGRSWTRSMAGTTEPEEEFTIESVARRAPWLKPGGREQD